MFSCLLLHSISSSEPLVAQKCDVNVQVVGQVGRGKATSTYLLDRDYTDVVLCVPSMIAHRDATKQHVRLTQCEIKVLNEEKTDTHAFGLTKLDPVEYSFCKRTLPKYAALKKRYKDLVTSYCGAHSCEDVLLHLGNLREGSKLRAHFEFLVKFTSTSTDRRLKYCVHNKLPTQQLSYNLNLASPLMVQDVSPLNSTSHVCVNGNGMQKFRWENLNSDRNIVQVSYEATFTTQETDLQLSPYSSRFVVQLADGVSAGSCCSFVSQKARIPASHGSSSAGHTHTPMSEWDGILMLSNTFSREQLPTHLQRQCFHPSEFVFVIDCSGSMSGTNIQAAADTLITCIKSLPEGSYFNVIAFGSTFRQLFHSSTEYSKHTVERAMTFANQLHACLGGTELLAPLRWIFKSSRCSGLPCQVFILTDGGVTNTQAVLHTVRKNRHQARCHTFGIGSEVCVELVTGIAAASGGRCVLLADGERLQTKVMEVLKDSLEPTVTDSILRWNPPEGYTVVDSTPKSLGTLYSGNSYTAFAFLKKTDSGDDNMVRHHPTSSGSVAITGMVSSEQAEIEIGTAVLPNLTTAQNSELVSILSQTAMWSKLQDLEMQMLASSRKNSSHEDKLEPAPKRPRLNGTITHGTQKDTAEPSVQEHLIESSLQSGIPCALTYFKCDAQNSSDHRLMQILPYNQNSNALPSSKAPNHGILGLNLQRDSRKRPRYPPHRCNGGSTTSFPFSITSLTKSTISTVSSTLKSAANIATLGLICPDSNPPVEGGQRIDDQLEYQQERTSQLYWDEDRQEIVYSPIYYTSGHPKGSTTRLSKGKGAKSHYKNSKRTSSSQSASIPPPLYTNNHLPQMPILNSNGSFLPLNGEAVVGAAVIANGYVGGVDISTSMMIDTPSIVTHLAEGGDDDDFTISDSESDSSVDPDWDDLRRPNQLLPLIHMQLHSGAWPIVRAFSFAVGVPLEEIRKLPLKKQLSTEGEADPTQGKVQPTPNTTSLNKADDESKAHFWTTALAIACMDEYFTQLRPEWELVAYKGERWLQQHSHQTDLRMEEVQRIAKELVLRQS